MTERLARACSRHPRRTFAAWGCVVLLALAAVALLLQGLTTDAHVTGHPESERAASLIQNGFPVDPRDRVTEVAVIRSARYTVDQPQFKALRRADRSGCPARDSRREARPASRPCASKDGHALAIPFALGSDGDAKPVVNAVRQADRSPDFAVTVSGLHTINDDFNTLSESDLRSGELRYGLPAALIILLLVFGAVVAGLVPLAMAIVSILVGMGLVAVLSQAFDLSVFIVNMLVGMGLALGIDYSLFVISRYREERGRGLEQDDAIAAAGATASRAVLFSGSAFVVALFGMLLVPTTIMRSLAAGAIVVGVVSVAAALTLLPALLGAVGDGINRGRVPFFGGASLERKNPEGRIWRAIVDRVLRHPAISLAISVTVLVVIASPVLGLKIGASGVATLPDRLESKQGYLVQQRLFPNLDPSPARIVASGASQPAVRQAFTRLRARLAADPRFGPGQLLRSPDGQVELLNVPLRGDPVGKQAVASVRDLRRQILPQAFASTGAKPLVGGRTAENVDYFDAVTNPAPMVFAFVLGLSLILLTIAFRSVVVALHGDRAQPALGRRRVRAARARVRARRRHAAARLPAGRRDRRLGAALPLLGAVRALDGLPGLPAQPDQGALRPARRHLGGRRVRRRLDRADHHRRRADHRRGLLGLRGRRPGDVPADGLRHRRRAAARRDGDPVGRAAVDDAAAR